MAIVLWLLLHLRGYKPSGRGYQLLEFPWETIRAAFFFPLQGSLNGAISLRGKVHGLPTFQ